MLLKKKRLAACKIYLILDTQVCDYAGLWRILAVVKGGGVDIVQLRDKIGKSRESLWFARKVRRFLPDRVLFIVNDRVDIARLSGAAGVHVGQEDIPVAEARKILGPRKIVGTSCQAIEHVRRASVEGADYVGFGSVFKTLTKPERAPMDLALLKRAVVEARRKDLPLFAIGGISRRNVAQVLACGVERVAVCRDILLAKDVQSSVGRWRHLMQAV